MILGSVTLANNFERYRKDVILVDCQRNDGQKFGEVFGNVQVNLKSLCQTMDDYTSPVNHRRVRLPVICDCVRTDGIKYNSGIGEEFAEVIAQCKQNDKWTRPANCRSL